MSPTERRAARIGILGGTFDPVHIGHLVAAEAVRSTLGLEPILFVPNNEPPHKVDHYVTAAADRVEMVRLAIASNPGFRLDTTEIDRPGPSYAVDTVRELHSRFGPEDELLLILGLDALFGLPAWHDPHELIRRVSLVAMNRPASNDRAIDARWERLEREFPGLRDQLLFVSVPQIYVSSHEIRDRVASRRSIRYLVPDAVAAYIAERGLYQDVASM